ncbi:MAG: pantetheine-phosphate adenylyltransferase [Rikenellaceae bacterium]
MESVAIFPGSFDPFTRGHAAIIKQAEPLFDKIIIAIGHNITKRGILEETERKRLIDELYTSNPKIECQIYTGLTGDFAQRVNAVAMIRGVRNTIDFEQEKILESTNRRLYPSLTTVLMFTPSSVVDVSSSAVRELLAFGRDVSEFLPEGVDINNYMYVNK